MRDFLADKDYITKKKAMELDVCAFDNILLLTEVLFLFLFLKNIFGCYVCSDTISNVRKFDKNISSWA